MTSANSGSHAASLPPHILQALSAVHDPRTSHEVRNSASTYLEEVKSSPDAPDWGYAFASDLSQPPAVRHFGFTLLEHGLKYGYVTGDIQKIRQAKHLRLQEELAQRTDNGSDEFLRLKAEFEDQGNLSLGDWNLREEGSHLIKVRGWVERLAASVGSGEQAFLRNKIAQLWVEIAKRTWGGEEDGWVHMDAALVALWEGRSPLEADTTANGDRVNGDRRSTNHDRPNTEDSRFDKIQFVLHVLETLSEDIFNSEDATVGIRGSELGKACVDVFVPASILAAQFPNRDSSGAKAEAGGSLIRCGEQGWVIRICELLDWCFGPDGGLSESSTGKSNEKKKTSETALKALAALKATVMWVMPKAISEPNVVGTIGRGLAVPIVEIQTAVIEALHAVYARHIHEEDFAPLIAPMYTSDTINLFREVYNWCQVDGTNVDEQKYILCKRLSELLANLANILEPRVATLSNSADLKGLLHLLYDMLQSPSLVVSIPCLHSWTRMLRSKNIKHSEVLAPLYPALLDACSRRLIRYEAFPEDSDDPVVVLLADDIDTVPERHSFLGNYRRYCMDIVEGIVRKSPRDALQHILRQADRNLRGLYESHPSFSPGNFSKTSIPFLQVDSQVTVIDAALRGYLKWLNAPIPDNSDASERENTRNVIQDMFEQWCQEILSMRFEDPEIGKKIVQLLVTFATRGLPTHPTFAVKVLEYLISLSPKDNPSYPSYSEGVKSFELHCATEMQRLAMGFADHFVMAYDQLERQINDRTSRDNVDDKLRLGYVAFLFIIVHRATTISEEAKAARLNDMIRPLESSWQDEKLTSSLSSFESFCELLGFSDLVDFFTRHRFHEVKDWASQSLDAEGRALQTEIMNRFQNLPLRMTKTLLSASTEKIRSGTANFEVSHRVWSNFIPSFLPNLLQMISHAQAFNNRDNWSHLPPELQDVMMRMLTDRFWQSGISTESRDDFFNRISGSRQTFEGFASTVRGTVRQIRELGYFAIFSLTAFPDVLYSIPDLPNPLADALFRNANALSAHHVSVLLGVASPLIELCPSSRRDSFLPPVVTALFLQLERKIGSEWDLVREARAREDQSGEDERLGDEMRKESILRQLTHTAVILASNMLEYKKETNVYHGQDSRDIASVDESEINAPIADFTLYTPSVLEPLFMFLRTTLLAPDNRSSSLAARVFRSILPIFSKHPSSSQANKSTPSSTDDRAAIRTFCTTDLLRAAITALHDPLLVDTHREIASLIAAIIALDPFDAPRSVLLSLPGLASAPHRVDRAIERIVGRTATAQHKEGTSIQVHLASDRTQRAVVLDLLTSIRGVGIHEMGRVDRRTVALSQAAAAARKRDATVGKWTQPQAMDVGDGGEVGRVRRDGMKVGDGEEGLDGVAGMFD